DNNLSDMTRLLHEMQRFLDIRAGKHAIRQRRENAFFDKRHDLAEQSCAVAFPSNHELVEIDAEITQIAPERPQTDMRVVHIIALAQFDKPPEWFKARNTGLHRLAGKAVQHDIDARPRRS